MKKKKKIRLSFLFLQHKLRCNISGCFIFEIYVSFCHLVHAISPNTILSTACATTVTHFPKWVSVTSSFNQLRACMTKTIFLKTKIYGFGKYTKWSDGWLLEINPWMKAISIVKNRCRLPVWLIDTCRQFNCHSRTRTTLIDWIKFGQNCEIWSKLWCLLH